MRKSPQVSITLPPEIFEWLKDEAARTDRDLSGLIEHIVSQSKRHSQYLPEDVQKLVNHAEEVLMVSLEILARSEAGSEELGKLYERSAEVIKRIQCMTTTKSNSGGR